MSRSSPSPPRPPSSLNSEYDHSAPQRSPPLPQDAAAFWDDLAASWDVQEGVQAFSAGMLDVFLTHATIDDLSQATVLDLGCGTGILSRKLAPLCRRVVAIDPSAKMLQVLMSQLVDASASSINVSRRHDRPAGGDHPDIDYDDDYDASHGDADDDDDDDDDAGKRGHNIVTVLGVLDDAMCERFLPDYDDVVTRIRSLLAPGGVFIQCDLEHAEASALDYSQGFNKATVEASYSKAGLDLLYSATAFELTVGGETLSVFAAIGRRPF